MTHLWEYDSLAHRAQIRANLAGDPEWIADYVQHLTPMLAEQVNSIVTQPKWADEMAKPKDGQNVYMMVQLDGVDHDQLESLIKSSEHAKHGRLVNCLIDDIGRAGRVTLIWQFDHLDQCRGLTQLGHSIVMLPAPWSPMQ